MPNNYQFNPRGVIKWQAFAAVISGDEQKDDVREIKKYDINLLDDYLDQLDLKLKEALITKSKVLIKYLNNNEYQVYRGYILNIDYTNMKITFDDLTLLSNQIIEIELIDNQE